MYFQVEMSTKNYKTLIKLKTASPSRMPTTT